LHDAWGSGPGQLATLGAPALVHCEDQVITAELERILKAAGRTDPGVLSEWRTREAELLAVVQVAASAQLTGAQVRVAHASNPEVLAEIAHARQNGARISGEVCPQYLFLRESDVLTEGAKRKFTPPARIRGTADEDAMWRAFNFDELGHLSSDHAPSTLEQKCGGDFWDAPFGLPGLDTTFPLMLDAALMGRTTLERIVDVYCAKPSAFYHLRGKGEIRRGRDADLVIVDPRELWTLEDGDVRSKAGWTPYSGRSIHGRVIKTILRGQVVFENGLITGEPIGRFVSGPT
jgi:dihydroorotase-like cyclic amidohydrolase